MMLGIYSMLQDSGMSQADINQMDLVLFFKTLAYKKSKKIKCSPYSKSSTRLVVKVGEINGWRYGNWRTSHVGYPTF